MARNVLSWGTFASGLIVAPSAWRSSMSHGRSQLCRMASALGLVLLASAAARAEVSNVKITLDWIIQGTHAPFFVAQEKGYFKDAGVTVDAIDKGNGATNVAV